MSPGGPGVSLGDLPTSGPAEKWKAIGKAAQSWSTTLRLCLILLVVEAPLVIGAVLWIFH